MKTDVWMPLYVADLLADTLHLSAAEFGSYLLLICAYWRNKGPLPDDDNALSRIARVTVSEWSATRFALAQHFQIEDGVWRHKRIDAELEKAFLQKEAKRRGAEATNRAKRDALRAQSDTVSDPSSPSPSSSSSPSTLPSSSPPPHSDRAEVGTESPIEPPPRFPRTEAEAGVHAANVGCPKEFAVRTWSKAMSRGGRDARDVPVRSWPHYLKTEWTFEQARLARDAPKRRIPEINQVQEHLEIRRL